MPLFHALPDYKIAGQNKNLDLSKPQVMGILNVTPDSFSDGGKYNSIDKALTHCGEMIAAGATIIDIGGESTRPNAKVVASDSEISRVVPIVEAIRKRFGHELWLSIDTSNPVLIEAAVDAGADIWNDVRALKREGAAEMAAKLNIPVVLMHMRGEPATMNKLAHYNDVVSEVIAELVEHIEVVTKLGVKRDNIIIDPGFGFAKNYEHHCALLTQFSQLQKLNLPLMFGISRKRFLAQVLDKSGVERFQNLPAIERDSASSAAGLFALQQGASIIRTHNVAMMRQMIALWQQLTHYKQPDL